MNSQSALDTPTRFVTVNGRQLAYRSIGEGVPLLLCVRFRGVLDVWDPAFLDALAQHFGLEIAERHRAASDALATAEVFLRLLDRLESGGVRTLLEARNFHVAPELAGAPMKLQSAFDV